MGRRAVLCAILLALVGCTSLPATALPPTSPAGLGDTPQALLTPPQLALATPSPAASVSTIPLVYPEPPADLVVRTLPQVCPGIGSDAYVEPDLPDVRAWQVVGGALVLEQGTIITVTNSSDEVNGVTSGVAALLQDPGTDGISLREALQAINQDPGEYTVRFDANLKGATIEVGSWDHNELPLLASGSLIVNGDVDGDGEPDVTLENALAQPGVSRAVFGLRIQSSNNTLYALTLAGFTNAVLLQPPSEDARHQVYSGNTLARLQIVGGNGIGLGGGKASDSEPIEETGNAWVDTQIIDNTFHARGGLSLGLARSSGDRIENLFIRGNYITIGPEESTDVYDGIVLTSGYGATAAGNTIENVLIADNVVEGNPNVGIGLLCGSGASGGNAIRNVYIIGNRVRMERTEILSTFGVLINAGYWVNQEGNTISDVLVAGNDLEGYQETVVMITAGAVGSSKNRVERIRLTGNRLKVTRPLRDNGAGLNALSISTGDGATDYQDPSFQPVVYPNDNVIRDIWVSRNLIEGQGGSAVVASTGVLGVERNEITGIYILGNEIRGYYPRSGILVSGVLVFHGGSGQNRIAQVYIQQNTIELVNQREGFIGEEFYSGGILVSTGNGSQNNSTEDVWIVGNEIASPAPGISIIGGWGDPQAGPAIGNRIARVRVCCNNVSQEPIPLQALFPDLKGINVAGGYGLASGNRVEDVIVQGNRVGGVPDDVSVYQNAGEGSTGNTAGLANPSP